VNQKRLTIHDLNEATEIAERLWTALKVVPPERLELLADWLDAKFPNDHNPEVQSDLRRMAKMSRIALARVREAVDG